MANQDASRWRAQVEKELAGAPFEKLVTPTPEGIAIQPLYTAASATHGVLGSSTPIAICMEVDGDSWKQDVDDGADALWFPAGGAFPVAGVGTIDGDVWTARGGQAWDLRFSALAHHAAGADAADELALILAAGAEALRAHGPADIARRAWLQIAVGRDTFGELCKLRALRVVWAKLLAACGAVPDDEVPVHAVCSTRTMTERDPWVNMLRVTTQVFAAILGGATLVTPRAYDDALQSPSALGRRTARNTALVLREESQLGRVVDPGGGSYYLETRTDALARAAWARFAQIERDGGLGALDVAGRLAASWAKRTAALAKRKEPVLGVSEFANLDEKLPAAPPAEPRHAGHRDAEAFESLRARVEAAPPTVSIIALGPPAEHRARVGYATAFFALAGLTISNRDHPDVAVICGSDERYAAEAAATAASLRARGIETIALAGRPGIAGVDQFLYLGCDALATLTELLV